MPYGTMDHRCVAHGVSELPHCRLECSLAGRLGGIQSVLQRRIVSFDEPPALHLRDQPAEPSLGLRKGKLFPTVGICLGRLRDS